MESLDLTYNPVLMRDKENRRDVVYFLHNRLPFFKSFNGIPIDTLFSRVSCGRDYVADIVDSTCKSPHFFVPSHHIITIGQEKNLCNRTVDKSSLSSPPLSIPLSPFCLDEMQSPSHDSDNSPRQPDPPAPSCPGHRSMIHSTTPTRTPTRRLRSVSMFERDPAETSSTTTQTVSSGDAAASVWKEPRGRRHRGYSVHDIILQTKEEPVTDAPAMPAMPAVPVGE